MKFKSEILTQASGSIGGTTYAHAKGGTLYRRARALPVQPNTTFQTTVRSAMTALVTQWTSTLTAAERAAWDTYGDNVPVVDALGSPINLSGQNWYIATGVPRLQALTKLGATGYAGVATAPAIFDRGDFTTPTVSSYGAAGGLSLAFTEADAWNNEALSGLLVFQGRPRNPSRIFFKGPYRLVGIALGAALGGTSPLAISAANFASLGYPIVEGQATNFVVAVTRADGRLSTRRDLGQVIAAA